MIDPSVPLPLLLLLPATILFSVGEKRILRIPPAMGYGDRGAGADIPGGLLLLLLRDEMACNAADTHVCSALRVISAMNQLLVMSSLFSRPQTHRPIVILLYCVCCRWRHADL